MLAIARPWSRRRTLDSRRRPAATGTNQHQRRRSGRSRSSGRMPLCRHERRLQGPVQAWPRSTPTTCTRTTPATRCSPRAGSRPSRSGRAQAASASARRFRLLEPVLKRGAPPRRRQHCRPCRAKADVAVMMRPCQPKAPDRPARLSDLLEVSQALASPPTSSRRSIACSRSSSALTAPAEASIALPRRRRAPALSPCVGRHPRASHGRRGDHRAGRPERDAGGGAARQPRAAVPEPHRRLRGQDELPTSACPSCSRQAGRRARRRAAVPQGAQLRPRRKFFSLVGGDDRAGAARASGWSRRSASGWWTENKQLRQELARALPVPQHHRQQPADAGGLRADRAGGPDRHDGADPRRDRHRQGAGRPRDPLQHAARRQAVRQGQLRGAAREPDRERAVRPREGRLHRRARAEKGRFELADGGTLFLDEIGDLSRATQVKLLRVLQEREFERVGGTSRSRSTCALIAATNRDLELAVQAGQRSARTSTTGSTSSRSTCRRCASGGPTSCCSPTTSSRSTRARHGKDVRRISTPAIDMLMAYHWPGNVRELENCIERAVLVCDGDVIHGHHLPPTLQTAEASGTVPRQSLGGRRRPTRRT